MSRPATLALGVVLALVIGAMVWWNLDRAAPVVAPTAPEISTPAVETATPADLSPALPALDGSDEFIREALAALGLEAPLAAGAQGKELVRTFVVAVNRVADGGSPRRQLGFLEPKGRFSAVTRGDQSFIDPDSYRRYDAVGAAIDALNADAAVRAFRGVQPLVEAAHAELGTGEPFEPVLMRALDVLLQAPVVTGDVELVDAIDRYRFADPTLEALPPASKHMVRMGPVNVETMQRQLRRIRDRLATTRPGG